MLLCTKLRLQVSEGDAQALECMQGTCRGLFTWWVLRRREGEPWPVWAEAKAPLQASKKLAPELCFVYGKLLYGKLLYGKLLHAVCFRLDKAMTAFLRRCQPETGAKPVFPRVRPRPCFL